MTSSNGFSLSSSLSSSSLFDSSDGVSTSQRTISLICSILNPIVYGFVNTIDKTIVSRRVHHTSSYVVLVGIVDALIGLIFLAFGDWSHDKISKLKWYDFVLPIVSGICCGLCNLLYFFAMEWADASKVVGTESVYPLFVVIWSLIFLSEKIPALSYVGIGLSIIGGVLLSMDGIKILYAKVLQRVDSCSERRDKFFAEEKLKEEQAKKEEQEKMVNKDYGDCWYPFKDRIKEKNAKTAPAGEEVEDDEGKAGSVSIEMTSRTKGKKGSDSKGDDGNSSKKGKKKQKKGADEGNDDIVADDEGEGEAVSERMSIDFMAPPKSKSKSKSKSSKSKSTKSKKSETEEEKPTSKKSKKSSKDKKESEGETETKKSKKHKHRQAKHDMINSDEDEDGDEEIAKSQKKKKSKKSKKPVVVVEESINEDDEDELSPVPSDSSSSSSSSSSDEDESDAMKGIPSVEKHSPRSNDEEDDESSSSEEEDNVEPSESDSEDSSSTTTSSSESSDTSDSENETAKVETPKKKKKKSAPKKAQDNEEGEPKKKKSSKKSGKKSSRKPIENESSSSEDEENVSIDVNDGEANEEKKEEMSKWRRIRRIVLGLFPIPIFLSGNDFFAKLSVDGLDSNNVTGFNSIGLGIVLSMMSIKAESRKYFVSEFKYNIFFCIFNELLTIMANYLMILGMVGLEAPIVSALSATRPLFVLILETIFRISKVPITQCLGFKVFPIICIIGGAILMTVVS